VESKKSKIEYLREVSAKFLSRKNGVGFSIFSSRFLLLSLLLTACNQIQSPKNEPFYAQKVTPPPVQEFRWSNGKLPKSFDPAFAAASPETDIVRAVYEGLTDVDPKTLQPVPAIAARWTASEDNKVWTFYLRRDAKWSNGETITAKDFSRSWKRLVELGDKISQRDLLKNIVGMDTKNAVAVFPNREIDALSKSGATEKTLEEKKSVNLNVNANQSVAPGENLKKTLPKPAPLPKKENFGVEATDNFTLKVTLVQPDANFPALVAHTIFRPIFDGDETAGEEGLNENIVTNGAFQIVSAGAGGIALERAKSYWDADQVALEKVRFVPMETAENALAAYRAGDIDAVTNADFQPLALKLLAPFDDFRQTTHSAINFYEFNLKNKPFDDRRVREALAVSIDRERLTNDEMDGVTEPALGFSPLDKDVKLPQDVRAAQNLLAEAGFANGENFPVIRLLVNRNNVQQRIARAVARMWKKNLNVETEVVVKDQADFEIALQNGEFDIVRRGVVLPTADETANMLALFPAKNDTDEAQKNKNDAVAKVPSDQILTDKIAESPLTLPSDETSETTPNNSQTVAKETPKKQTILTERQALEQLPAIPLYFPTSYSLVKPYVQGFDSNALDTPSLKNVTIDNNWQPAAQKVLSKGKN
jgi:oligopeptide transport system substrate-binding protein